LKRDEGPEL